MPNVYYTNFVQVRAAFFDVTLRLHRVSEVEGEGGPNAQPVLEEVARVQMSPQHAKALLTALQTSIVGYESRFGPIAMPKLEGTGDDTATE